MIRSQFTEQDFFSVVGNTEIPSRAIPSLVLLLTDQRVMELLSTPDPDKVNWGDTEAAAEEYAKEMDKYRLRMSLQGDPKAMIAAILYGHNYYYSLCMRNKDRKGRLEGVKLGTGGSVKEEAEGVGLSQKVLHSLGLGRLTKYNRVYLDKE